MYSYYNTNVFNYNTNVFNNNTNVFNYNTNVFNSEICTCIGLVSTTEGNWV